jgi:PAS domain S-box-containing protein
LEKQRRRQSAEFLATFRRVGGMLEDRLLRHSEQNLSDAKADLLQAGERANASILVALLLSVAFGLGTGYLTTRSITAPLRQLSSAMLAIARGDRAHTVDLATSDELRSLGDAFNLMTGHLFRANEDLREEIASRRKTEEALRMSEDRFRTIVEDAPIGIGLTDTSGRLAHTNAALQEMLGFDGVELADRTLADIVDQNEPLGDRLGSPLDGGGTFGRYQSEAPCRRKDGSIAWINLNVSRLQADPAHGPCSIIMLEDITERKQMELKLNRAERDRLLALRRFALSVQKAQEDERARIARELHDDLCQRLTGMKFRVEVLEDRLIPADRRAGRRLRDFAQELDRTIVDVRRISSNLRPSVLDDFGLVTALRLLCRDFEKTHSIRTTFEEGTIPSRRVDPSIEIALYRIAQEALSNIARHAGATAVTLRLTDDRDSLSLVVEDNGKGFDRERAARSKPAGHGIGLVSMRERTELLGGAFDLQSGEGIGTVVRSTIPLGGSDSHETN